jgi:hypothetical protein
MSMPYFVPTTDNLAAATFEFLNPAFQPFKVKGPHLNWGDVTCVRSVVKFTGANTVACRVVIGESLHNLKWWFMIHNVGGTVVTAYVALCFLWEFVMEVSLNKQVRFFGS